MKELRFKTNIKCDGCLTKVTPGLNDTVGQGNWKVDLQNPEKFLTIEGNVSEEQVLKTLAQVGFQAEKV